MEKPVSLFLEQQFRANHLLQLYHPIDHQHETPSTREPEPSPSHHHSPASPPLRTTLTSSRLSPKNLPSSVSSTCANPAKPYSNLKATAPPSTASNGHTPSAVCSPPAATTAAFYSGIYSRAPPRRRRCKLRRPPRAGHRARNEVPVRSGRATTKSAVSHGRP